MLAFNLAGSEFWGRRESKQRQAKQAARPDSPTAEQACWTAEPTDAYQGSGLGGSIPEEEIMEPLIAGMARTFPVLVQPPGCFTIFFVSAAPRVVILAILAKHTSGLWSIGARYRRFLSPFRGESVQQLIRLCVRE